MFVFATAFFAFIVGLATKSFQDNRLQAAIGPGEYPYQTPKVLVLQYLPEKTTQKGYLDGNITGTPDGTTIASMRDKLKTYTAQALTSLTTGSDYRNYSTTQKAPYLRYQQVGFKEYLEPLPRGMQVPWNSATYRPDFKKILARENICDWVDNKGVRQVWLWGYHHKDIEPVESNMSMGLRSKQWWNKSGYGDVSNSEQSNDLPQCNNTYVLFNYNMTRGVGEMIEDHMHQFESTFGFLGKMDPAEVQLNGGLFWGRFVGQSQQDFRHITAPGCGSTHFPPNTSMTDGDYQWYKMDKRASDCMNWRPDGGGTTTQVNCQTWSGKTTCPDDGGTAYKVWWMKAVPSTNNGLTYKQYPLKNWWDSISDFDLYMRNGGGLVRPTKMATPTPKPTPTPTPRPTPTPTPTATPVPKPDYLMSRVDKTVGGKYKSRLVTPLSKPDTSLSNSRPWTTIYKSGGTGRLALHECYIQIWDDYMLAAFPSTTRPSTYCGKTGEEYRGIVGYVYSTKTVNTPKPFIECFDETNLNHFYVTYEAGCDDYAKEKNLVGKVKKSWTYGWVW